ncbi:MAG: hypothetical protein JWR16_2719 [Nevskia sp.]|nr:hypothetical protein [Nevskia sp.]
MDQDKTAIDEARRQQQHGAVKREIEGGVHGEIRAHATAGVDTDAAKLQEVATRLRGKAIDDVVSTDSEIERQRGIARLAQFVDYLFYLIYGLLALRFVLALIGARQGAGFVRFINGVTAPLFAPFKGTLPSNDLDTGMVFSTAVLLALVVYALLHAAIKGLLRVVGRRRTEI